MKIQLTRSKTIEIGFRRKSEKASKSKVDLTGVELFSGESRGVPAVRIASRKDGWHLVAAGYVPPPDGELPSKWEDVPHQPVWELPRGFQAPSAAIAVNSSMSSFGQASAEAVLKDMAQGLAHEPHATIAPRLALKRPAPSPSEPAAKSTAPSRPASLPEPGKPVSENGRRFSVRPFAEDGFHLSASLPEFQALWLSRLLPEGRSPTATSIQLAESALMASPVLQPTFIEDKGSLLVVLVQPHSVFFAGYKNGAPALWRRCPGVKGYEAMSESVCKSLGVDSELVNDVLEDSFVDPRPALEPFLMPIFKQLDLARAYLAGKHAIQADHALLLGLPFGAMHWRHMAEESIKMHLVHAHPFDGIKADKGVEAPEGHRHMIALGAALAAAEVSS